MSLQIKSLTVGTPVIDRSLASTLDSFNILKEANQVYDLYIAPNNSPNASSAIVKGIRLVNTHPTATVKVTLYFNRPDDDGRNRRRLLTPADMSLPPNFIYLDDSDVTLEPEDRIQAKTDTANVVQYLISGVEREES